MARDRPLAVAEQLRALQRASPPGTLLVTRAGARWTTLLQPSPFSRVYTTRFVLRPRFIPRVIIEAPALEPRHGPVPHRFGDGSLCLFYGDECSAARSPAETILPWTLEWLFHYEVWLATGRWEGGGVEHSK